MTKELARIYRPADFYRWPGPLTHPSNHDPLWLHKFGQPWYRTVTDYGQHLAREAQARAEWDAIYAELAEERYQAAKARMNAPKPKKQEGINKP